MRHVHRCGNHNGVHRELYCYSGASAGDKARACQQCYTFCAYEIWSCQCNTGKSCAYNCCQQSVWKYDSGGIFACRSGTEYCDYEPVEEKWEIFNCGNEPCRWRGTQSWTGYCGDDYF